MHGCVRTDPCATNTNRGKEETQKQTKLIIPCVFVNIKNDVHSKTSALVYLASKIKHFYEDRRVAKMSCEHVVKTAMDNATPIHPYSLQYKQWCNSFVEFQETFDRINNSRGNQWMFRNAPRARVNIHRKMNM